MSGPSIRCLLALSTLLFSPIASRAAPVAPKAPRIVVWVRSATENEMRLSSRSSPTLRALARRGVSLLGLPSASREEWLSALRAAAHSAGVAVRSVPFRTARTESALEQLFAELGRPGAAAPETRADLDRLRQAHPEQPARSPLAPAPPAAPSARGASEDRGPPTPPDFASEVTRSLGGASRVILIDDPHPAGPMAEEEREAALARLLRALDTPKRTAGEPATIAILLLPAAGRPALVAAGPRLARGRVLRRSLSPSELAGGLVEAVASEEPAAGGAASRRGGTPLLPRLASTRKGGR